MDDYLDELKNDVERITSKMSGYTNDLVLIAAEIERIHLFDHLQELILEKDNAGDTLAVEVLSWAYEQLSEACE